MALANSKVVKKVKKHGVKAGQKRKVRPSQKKSVKNGRHQEKETPKSKNVKKAVQNIPAGLDGAVTDDELEPFGDLPEPEFGFDESYEPENYEPIEPCFEAELLEDGVSYPDKES